MGSFTYLYIYQLINNNKKTKLWQIQQRVLVPSPSKKVHLI